MNYVTMATTPTTNAIPGLLLTDRRFEVPLDYENPTCKLEIFVREAVAAGKEKLDLPCLVFFQGGPGSGAPRPLTHSGWIKRMTQEYRVLLLDQRGTGLSTPVTAQSLSRLSPKERAMIASYQASPFFGAFLWSSSVTARASSPMLRAL